MRKETDLTAPRLRELLRYDSDTGLFHWKVRPCNRVKVGDVAGRITHNGYRSIQLDGTHYIAQRLAWLYVYGEWPKSLLRFIDDDITNCRIGNLRDAEAVTLGLSYKNDGTPDASFPMKRSENVTNYYRNMRFQKEFGINLADYHDMLIAQGGKCAICEKAETARGRDEKVKWLAVDHCHDTGVVRSLLCQNCNLAVGYAKDDPDLLRAAADYIERHRNSGQTEKDPTP